jgi:hypothetical protein
MPFVRDSGLDIITQGRFLGGIIFEGQKLGNKFI